MERDKMVKPFFSIIIPTYNSEKYVTKAIDSVIAQTFKDFEVLLVDDGSVDNTVGIVRNKIAGLTNFKIIVLKQNSGVAEARNTGIFYSRGKYICFLDDDDLWLKDKLKVEYDYIVNKKLNWVFSNYEVLNDKYEHLGTRFRIPGIYNYDDIIKHGNPIGMLTVTVRADILKENKFLNVGHEDYDLWLRLAKKGYEGYLIRDVLAQYVKKNTGSISSNKFKSVIWTYKCFRRNGYSVVGSVKLILGYIINVFQRKKII